MFLQVPTLFIWLHDTQVVLHAVSQQTPCGEQNVDWQSTVLVQGDPLALPPLQVGAWQKLGDVQSALLAQLVWQAPFAPHAYGLHEVDAPATHVPVPLQVLAPTAVALLQLAAAQEVPAA